MRNRWIGVLDGAVYEFQTYEEARLFTTAIPGVRGWIFDRLVTPIEDLSELTAETAEDSTEEKSL